MERSVIKIPAGKGAKQKGVAHDFMAFCRAVTFDAILLEKSNID